MISATPTPYDGDHLDPDATSIYDIRSTPYDVDRVNLEDTSNPDAVAIFDIRSVNWNDLDTTSICIRTLSSVVLSRRHLILEIRQGIMGLRAALASGWDIGPELAYEERRLAALEAA
jgi:hypothetical protein